MNANRSPSHDRGIPAPREIAHSDPAWRDRADFILAAAVSLDGDSVSDYEQIWARQLSPTTFEICCIPFIAYDLALGDIVEAKPERFMIERLVAASGHFTFRAWLTDAANDGTRDALIAGLEDLGVEWEWMSPRLVSIDAPTEEIAGALAGQLMERETRGELAYETGRSH
jgi:hypothetical protein